MACGGLAFATPDSIISGKHTTHADVNDESLVLEVAVDVAGIVGDQHAGSAPGGGVRGVGVDVVRNRAPSPGEELDVIVGPLNSVDTAIGGAVGVRGGGRGCATLVGILVGRLLITVGRVHLGSLASRADEALALFRGLVGVSGGLVDLVKVPAFEPIELSLRGPRRTVRPALPMLVPMLTTA